MLRVTTLKKRSKVVLTVEGRLAGDSVSTLEQCWRELRAASPTEKFNVDLCGVSFIDAAGKTLLKEIYRQGGRLVAQGCLNQETVKEITGAAEGRSESESKKDTKRSHIIFYIAFFSLLLAPTLTPAHSQRQQNPLRAEAPYSGVMRLTLDQAVALALKQNTTAQIAVLSAAQSDQDQKIAMSALLPQAQLGVTEQWQRINILAQFGGTRIFPGFPAHVGPYSTFSAGPSFNGPIFDLTLFRRYQASRNAANASRADSLSTREQVILLVVSQYIGTLRSMADVEASQSRVDLAQALYDQAADLQKEGVGTGIDTLRANVELQNEKQRLLEAQATRETSLFARSLRFQQALLFVLQLDVGAERVDARADAFLLQVRGLIVKRLGQIDARLRRLDVRHGAQRPDILRHYQQNDLLAGGKAVRLAGIRGIARRLVAAEQREIENGSIDGRARGKGGVRSDVAGKTREYPRAAELRQYVDALPLFADAKLCLGQ